MSSIYIHIPFCKQACHYCDFHFSTSLKYKDDMVAVLCEELRFRESEFKTTTVQTIYLGGGTPSLLSHSQIDQIIATVYRHYKVVDDPEITLEANPDDLTEQVLKNLSQTAINRLSIGVQSFCEDDLTLMNRAHNAPEALTSILTAQTYYDNISIDLIYGIPGMSIDRWRDNIYKAIELDIPHISSYALTVEENTALESMIKKGKITAVDEAIAHEHYNILLDAMQLHGYVNYEFSNFGKQGYFSKNNTAYWTGKSYIGIGPSAHSFNGQYRSWNISNNVKYIKSIQQSVLPSTVEKLTTIDRYNEYVMTGLRTINGISLSRIEQEYGDAFKKYLLEQSSQYLKDHLLYLDDDKLTVTRKGKFLSDGIASELFMINLVE